MEEITQPTPQTPPQPKNNSSLFIGILIFILGILAGLTLDKTTIISGLRIPYLGATPTPTLLPTPTPTPDATANWKTYTNFFNQSSFKYPPEYTVTSTPTFTTIKTNIKSFMVSDTDTPEVFNYYIQISLDQPSNFAAWSKYESTKYLGTEKINGYDFEKYIVGDMYWHLDYMYKDPSGLLYRFMLAPYDSAKTPVDLVTRFTQILSTFKFVDQAPTPTCRPRPACLDATPRCLIPETSDMCPPSPKPTPTTYTCPANGWVDCMPGPTVKPECSTAAMTWYRANCPDFKGGAL